MSQLKNSWQTNFEFSLCKETTYESFVSVDDNNARRVQLVLDDEIIR